MGIIIAMMVPLFLGGMALFYCGMQLQRRKERAAKEQRSLTGPWPIQKVRIEQLSPLYQCSEFGPKLETEISFLPNIRVKGGISDLETWILCTSAKQAAHIFEFGTCTGKTTYLLARNSPKEAQIITMTLPPDQISSYQNRPGDSALSYSEALAESCYGTFYYSGTSVEKKISQIFEDSKKFDEAPFAASFDLIFIDGSHAYSYVKSDSEKAFKMIKKGGKIFWHDYRGPKRNHDVFKALNELSRDYPLKHIEKTSLVYYEGN